MVAAWVVVAAATAVAADPIASGSPNRKVQPEHFNTKPDGVAQILQFVVPRVFNLQRLQRTLWLFQRGAVQPVDVCRVLLFEAVKSGRAGSGQD